MKRVLGRKQGSDQAAWLEAVAQIKQLVSRKELDAATKEACDNIREKTKDKKTAYAWSGGKDSLVIGDLCQKLGIASSIFVHTDLEYPAFLTWCLDHLPQGCEVINTGQNIDWLVKHPQMIFPESSAIVSRWFGIVQRAGIQQYYLRNKLDLIIVGHRKADGNYVGKGSALHENAAGVIRYSPLADWPHEMLLAYIAYHKLPLPPIYDWKDGYRCGTHPWPSRMGMKSQNQGWQEVYDIDPSIVRLAAEKIDSAANFLREVSA